MWGAFDDNCMISCLQSKSTEKDLKTRVCSEGHNGAIIGCCGVHENEHMSTAGVDGTFIIWDASCCRQVSKLTGCGLSTALATSLKGNLAALGSDMGVLR